MEVEIISTKFIKPSSPTPNHLQNYKLGFFDQTTDETHLPLVFFYPPTNNINFSAHEEQLEQSLSRILTHVYPISGRFTEDNSISCQDQGVKFIKAKVNSKLNEFLEKARLGSIHEPRAHCNGWLLNFYCYQRVVQSV
uniref:Anthocyanin acyltransferase n=1 Tax=Solanum tuberosum TaxID=4113 RepID=M1CUS4_SOLTU